MASMQFFCKGDFCGFPWSTRISADGMRTLLADVNSESLKPDEWETLADEKPHLLSLSDISIYELHIRDFRWVHIVLAAKIINFVTFFTILMRLERCRICCFNIEWY